MVLKVEIKVGERISNKVNRKISFGEKASFLAKLQKRNKHTRASKKGISASSYGDKYFSSKCSG